MSWIAYLIQPRRGSSLPGAEEEEGLEHSEGEEKERDVAGAEGGRQQVNKREEERRRAWRGA